MVKKIFIVLIAVITTIRVSAQTVDEVTLIVSSTGSTKEEARLSALRDAIEQAYGTFVSANTSILDDEVIKDEIVTVSSGNIRKYTELGTIQLPNGNTSITLQATVSVSKLITYAQSKGSECEFAGQTFAMNLKLDRLNLASAEKAIDHLIDQLKPLIPNMFDFRLKVSNPRLYQLNENLVITHCTVFLQQSPNVKIVFETLINTLTAIHRLALNGETAFFVLPDGSIGYPSDVINKKQEEDYRKKPWDTWDEWDQFRIPKNAAHKLMVFLTREITAALLNWRIKDNIGTIYEPKYSGNIAWEGKIYTPQGQKASELAELPLLSDIVKIASFDISVLNRPRCGSYNFSTGHHYASNDYIVCFPCYDMKTKNLKLDRINGNGFQNRIAEIAIFIPVNHIDKFTSFTIEHK